MNGPEDFEVILDSEELEDYLFEALSAYGYAATRGEIEDLSDIIFDYLVGKGHAEEIDEEDFE